MNDPFNKLKADIVACTRCELWERRTNVVVGRGPRQSNLVVIGEAPGQDEDRLGKAFVGRAGKKMDDLLIKSGITPLGVLFTNLLRCRPPQNRFPSDPEIPRACFGHLERQLKLVQPRIVLLVGKQAARWFLLDGRAMGTMRTIIGPTYAHTNFPFIEQIHVTYHPAFLLRANDDSLDKKVIATLKQVASALSKSGRLRADVTVGPKPEQMSLF